MIEVWINNDKKYRKLYEVTNNRRKRMIKIQQQIN